MFLLLFLPFLAVSQGTVNQTDANGQRQGLWKRNFPNGKPMYEGVFKDGKPVGEWKRFHDNGKLRAVLLHKENSDSVAAKLFDPEGKLIAEGNYIDEKKVGKWFLFNSGLKVSEEEFDNGIKSGISRTFYNSGELLEESEWKNGEKNGSYRAFYRDGKPFLECKYENDQRNGFCVTFFPSGVMEIDGFYQNDLPHGEFKYFSEDGKERITLRYNEGILLNPKDLLEMETKQLQELERQGKTITDPEKYLHNPMEYLLKNQK